MTGKETIIEQPDDFEYTEMIQHIRQTAPIIFSKFTTKLVESNSFNIKDDEPTEIYRQVSCRCGEEKLHISAYAIKKGPVALTGPLRLIS